MSLTLFYRSCYFRYFVRSCYQILHQPPFTFPNQSHQQWPTPYSASLSNTFFCFIFMEVPSSSSVSSTSSATMHLFFLLHMFYPTTVVCKLLTSLKILNTSFAPEFCLFLFFIPSSNNFTKVYWFACDKHTAPQWSVCSSHFLSSHSLSSSLFSHDLWKVATALVSESLCSNQVYLAMQYAIYQSPLIPSGIIFYKIFVRQELTPLFLVTPYMSIPPSFALISLNDCSFITPAFQTPAKILPSSVQFNIFLRSLSTHPPLVHDTCVPYHHVHSSVYTIQSQWGSVVQR